VEDVIEEDKIQIPHSLIYTFVENAIKHGLKPKVNDRKMEIRVEQVKEQTRITIQDNGIGRQRSKELNTTDTGKGMEIIKTIIKGYNQLYGEHISYTVEDVLDKQREAMGAKVEIWF
jgi:LytS/YehU family sensor histidine kinase